MDSFCSPLHSSFFPECFEFASNPRGNWEKRRSPPLKCTRMHICKTSHQGPNKVWGRRKCSELKLAWEKRRQAVICGLFNRDGFNYVGPKQTLHTNQGLLLQGHLRWPSRQIGLCHERIRPANTYRRTLRHIQIMMTPPVSPREDMDPLYACGFLMRPASSFNEHLTDP